MMDRRFNTFLVISITLHTIFFTLFAISKNFYKPYKQSQEHVFFMHVVNMSDINNIKSRFKTKSKLPKIENAKKVDNQLPKPSHPQVKDRNQNVKIDKIHQKPQNTESKTTEFATKSEPKNLQPGPIKTKPISTSQTKNPKKEIDLKELEKFLSQKSQVNKERVSEGTKDKSNKKSGSTNKDDQDASSIKYNPNMEEFANARTLLKQRIENNWNKPLSMRDYNKLQIRVDVIIDLNQDVDSISNFEFLNETVPESVKIAIKDSIMRAIKLSAPFDFFAIEHYEHWRNITLNFSYN